MNFFLSFVPRNYPPFICLCIWSIVLQCKYFLLSITLSLCATGLLWPIFAKPLTKKVKVEEKTDTQTERQTDKKTDTDRQTDNNTDKQGEGKLFWHKKTDKKEERKKGWQTRRVSEKTQRYKH